MKRPPPTPPGTRRPALASLLALALAAAPLAPVTAAPDPREESLLDEIEQLDTDLEKARLEVAALTRRLEAQERTIAATRTALEPVQQSLASRRDHIARRLRALYRFTERSFVKLLFSSSDHRDWMKRSRALWFILAEDARALASYRALLDERTRLLAEQQATQAALETSLAERRAHEQSSKAALSRRKALLEEVRRTRDPDRLALRAHERRAAPIDQATRRDLPLPATPRSGFALQRGRLVPPATGPVTRPFGRYTPPGSAEPILHKGVDIAAPEGSPIRSVYRGTVRQAGWMRGYGNLAIVDHGGSYFTVYAHARSFTVSAGAAVETGQVIGEVGATGSLTGPYLYFEVRYRGEPQDPLDWIALPPAHRASTSGAP